MTVSTTPITTAPSRRGFLGAVGFAGGALFLLSACSGSEAETGPIKAGAKGGKLTFAWLGFPEALEPHANSSFAGVNLSNNTTDKLIWQNPETGEIGPWLATKWETNEDLTEYTFTLREDVTFSDGGKFNAQVVKDNLDEYVNGNEKLKVLPNGAAFIPAYDSTEVVSEFVAKVKFKTPAASFLQFASYSGNYQLGFNSPNTLKRSAAERLKPANFSSTGPFTVTEYVENEKVVLTRRADYNWAPAGLNHEGPALLDSIEFRSIPESSVRIGALQSGDVAAAYDILPTDQKVLTKSGYTLISRQIAGINLGWHFNLSLPETADIAVRRAIVAATDRAGYKKNLLADSEGQARSALADTVPGSADYSEGALRYDLDLAKKLLDDAGWKVGADGVREKDGRQLKLKASSNWLVPNARVTYQAVQASLKQIGIEVDILFDTSNVSTDQINAEFHLINNNTSRNDPGVLNQAFNPEKTNRNQVPDDFPQRAELIATLSALDTTLERSDRDKLAKAAQDLIHEELALYNPVFIPSQVAATKTVADIALDATSRLVFLKTTLGK